VQGLGDLRRRQAVIDEAQRLVVDELVEVALRGQQMLAS